VNHVHAETNLRMRVALAEPVVHAKVSAFANQIIVSGLTGDDIFFDQLSYSAS